jgi:hypothetical protein
VISNWHQIVATKLWAYCQRPQDKYGRREACEVAAGTAQRLFRRGRRRERERERDGYDYDDNVSAFSSSDDSDSRRRRRTRRRRRSSVGLGYNGGSTGPQMIPGASPQSSYLQPTYGGAQLQPQVAQVAGAYGLSPHMGGRLAMPGVNYQQQAAMQQQYVPSYPAAQPGYPASYGAGGLAGGLGVPQVGRPRANSFGYPPASPTFY